MKIQATLLSLVIFVLAGCATTPPLNTASGRPEVTVKSRSVSQVRTVTVNHFVDLGFAPLKTEGSQLVFDKEGSAGQALLMGMLTDNPQSQTRITVTLIENGADVRVVASVAALGQSNFGRQQAVELSGRGYQQLQGSLQTIKARAER